MSEYKESASRRRDQRATVGPEEAPPKAPGKKDTKKWCKGKIGREHVFERRPMFPQRASLGTVEVCLVCGKQRNRIFPPLSSSGPF